MGIVGSTVAYEVSTPVYEGPLDMLLQLVTAERVDLWEVSITRIVDAFLAHCVDLGEVDLELATQFALIAAVLVELKCRRMLPRGDDSDLEDELEGWQERDGLLARLVECATFKHAGTRFAAAMEVAARSVERQAGMEEPYASMAPDVLAGIGVSDLRSAYAAALRPRPAPPSVDTTHMPPPTPSVGEVAVRFVTEIRRATAVSFASLVQGESRIGVVVGFLALLELYKQEYVDLDQIDTFGDLRCTWRAQHGRWDDGPGLSEAIMASLEQA